MERIGVIGGGTMGHGIAAAFALHGAQVNLVEPSATQRDLIMPAIETALALLVAEDYITAAQAATGRARVHVFGDLAPAMADREFVVEAAPERMALKQALLCELDGLCPHDTILATNTSSLPLAPMIAHLPERRQARTMVTHWYNPPLVMPLVELSFFGNMAPEIYAQVAALHGAIGKQVVKVLKDAPGLVANRIQMAVAREVFSIIEQGIAEPADVDRALKFGPAFRYATTGQLEVADFGGLDIWLTVSDNLLAVMDASTKANDLLRAKVTAGKLGVKTGAGFFAYPPERVAAVRAAFMKRLVHQLKASKAYI